MNPAPPVTRSVRGKGLSPSELERRVDVLVADLVYGLLLVPAGVELVGEVQHVGVSASDVLVCVHDARWDGHEHRVVLPDLVDLLRGWLAGPVLPERQAKRP